MRSSSHTSLTMRAVSSPLKRTCSLPCLRSLQFIVYRGYFSWPFKLVMKCVNVDDNEQLRTYQPSSDFIFLQSKLPRLLVQVNSRPKNDWPEDLVRMLVTGAAVVRFVNTFLERFDGKFVLFAIYIRDDGEVSRYTLFEEQDFERVCWTWYISEPAG